MPRSSLLVTKWSHRLNYFLQQRCRPKKASGVVQRSERPSMNGGGAEREGDTIGNRLQAPSRQPRARRGARTHGPRDRDLAEVGRLTDCATQAPRQIRFFFFSTFIYFLGQRETEHERGRGRERGRHNRKQAPGSEPSAQSLTQGSNSRTAIL